MRLSSRENGDQADGKAQKKEHGKAQDEKEKEKGDEKN